MAELVIAQARRGLERSGCIDDDGPANAPMQRSQRVRATRPAGAAAARGRA